MALFAALKYLNRLNPLPNRPLFVRVCSTSSLKTLMKKGEIARHEQLLLFPQCFLRVWRSLEDSKMCCLGNGYGPQWQPKVTNVGCEMHLYLNHCSLNYYIL